VAQLHLRALTYTHSHLYRRQNFVDQDRGMEPLIFVVDNQPESCEFIRSCLESTSFIVRSFPALQPADDGPPALIILGLHSEIHFGTASEGTMFIGVPRLVVADARSQENQLAALNVGADDWISKPFTPSELILRVETLLRGATQTNDLESRPAADIIIDSWAMKVCVRGREVTTTMLEFRLVEYLARHRGQVFTRDFLLDAVWGNMRFVNPRSVDACIGRIREKIERDRTRPTMLKTVRGVGYRLDAMAAWRSAPTESCGCAACKTRIGALPVEALGATRRKLLIATSS
jgi:DNA-binding response OmpR family regulator